ncbi:MAG TPA: MATE family efflux transporter [Bacillota bacterium]
MAVRNGASVARVFGKNRFYYRVFALAWPIVLQNFIAAFLNIIDTVMVGKLGETEIAAVGLANQYFFFFHMFLIGLCAGCSVFIAQFWGTKDTRNIRRIVGIGLGSVALVAFFFMGLGYLFSEQIIAVFNNETSVILLGAKYLRIVLAGYLFTAVTFLYSFALRSIGDTFQPMLISAAALLINVFFNYVFIFGKLGAPAMGVEGAALATVIARVVETVFLVGSVYRQRGVLAASGRELFDVNLSYIKKTYRIIFPVLLNDLCWGLAAMVYTAVYGHMGSQVVAAIQIVNSVSNLFMVVIYGISNAAAVMVGNCIGAGKVQQGKVYARKFTRLSVAIGFLLGGLLAFASPYMLRFFNVSAQALHYARIILYVVSAIFFIRVLDIILITGILRGGGDARYALLTEGFTMWFIGVPLTIGGAFLLKLPAYIVYTLAIVEEIVKCALGLRRLRSGRWIKKVTRNITG